MHNHLYKPSVLARLTTTLQEVLFPNGEVAPSVPDPTESEAQDLVDRLIARLLEVFPREFISLATVVEPGLTRPYHRSSSPPRHHRFRHPGP